MNAGMEVDSRGVAIMDSDLVSSAFQSAFVFSYRP